MECFPFLRLAAHIPLTQLAFCWSSLLSDRESLRSKKGTGAYSPLSSSFFFLRYEASCFVSHPSSSQPLGRENQTHKLLVHLTGEKNWQTPLVQLSIPFMPCTHFIFVQVFFTSAEIRRETRQWDGCQEDVRAPMQHTFLLSAVTQLVQPVASVSSWKSVSSWNSRSYHFSALSQQIFDEWKVIPQHHRMLPCDAALICDIRIASPSVMVWLRSQISCERQLWPPVL